MVVSNQAITTISKGRYYKYYKDSYKKQDMLKLQVKLRQNNTTFWVFCSLFL